jgi:H+/Cl- antiporter ClcA
VHDRTTLLLAWAVMAFLIGCIAFLVVVVLPVAWADFQNARNGLSCR